MSKKIDMIVTLRGKEIIAHCTERDEEVRTFWLPFPAQGAAEYMGAACVSTFESEGHAKARAQEIASKLRSINGDSAGEQDTVEYWRGLCERAVDSEKDVCPLKEAVEASAAIREAVRRSREPGGGLVEVGTLGSGAIFEFENTHYCWTHFEGPRDEKVIAVVLGYVNRHEFDRSTNVRPLVAVDARLARVVENAECVYP